MEEPIPDSERDHLLGEDARKPKRNQARNDRLGPQLAWGATVLAGINLWLFLRGIYLMEPMLYVWSILVTISFAGWVVADGPKAKRGSVLALSISFIPFIYMMFRMFMSIIFPNAS